MCAPFPSSHSSPVLSSPVALLSPPRLTTCIRITARSCLPPSPLPPPLSDVIGRIAPGWPLAGVSLAGCLGDQHAAVLGQSCAVGEAKATYGTGCFILMPTGPQPCASSHGLITTLAHCLAPSPASHPSPALQQPGGASGSGGEQQQQVEGELQGQGQEEAQGAGGALPSGCYPWPPAGSVVYALEGSIAIAGAAVQWLRDSLGVIQSAAEVQTLAQSVDNTGGVYFVPAFR